MLFIRINMLDPQLLFILLQSQGNDQLSTALILLSFDHKNHAVHTDTVSAAQFCVFSFLGRSCKHYIVLLKDTTLHQKSYVINSVEPTI